MRFDAHKEGVKSFNIAREAPLTTETEEIKLFKSSEHFIVIPSKISHKYGGETKFLDRFLKASDFNQRSASKLIEDVLEFRDDHALDDKRFSNANKTVLYKTFTDSLPVKFWGFGNQGHTLAVANLKNVRTRALLKEFNEDEILDCLVEFNERNIFYQAYANAKIREADDREWKNTVVVVDLEGLPMSQLLNMKAMKLLRRNLTACQKVYPETMEKVYFVNASRMFKVFWTLYSQFMSKKTLAKIDVLSKGSSDKAKVRAILSKYVPEKDIDDIVSGN